MKKLLPSASKELDGIIDAAKGIEAGVDENNKAVIIKYYKELLSNLIALKPKLSKYPSIQPVLSSNIVAAMKLIEGLENGTATIQDVNESNRCFASILEKAIPKSWN